MTAWFVPHEFLSDKKGFKLFSSFMEVRLLLHIWQWPYATYQQNNGNFFPHKRFKFFETEEQKLNLKPILYNFFSFTINFFAVKLVVNFIVNVFFSVYNKHSSLTEIYRKRKKWFIGFTSGTNPTKLCFTRFLRNVVKQKFFQHMKKMYLLYKKV